MAISDFAKQYHEKMFPEYRSAFLDTDAEFLERFDNFAFDEVARHGDFCLLYTSPSPRDTT